LAATVSLFPIVRIVAWEEEEEEEEEEKKEGEGSVRGQGRKGRRMRGLRR
jgi:hypothetical protein